jgi:flavin-dependent dehydrogenase
VFERRPSPAWRASGVYGSPSIRAHLEALGLDRAAVSALIRPIRAMDVRTTTGAGCVLEHEPPWACGVDRVRLERSLLDRASAAGATVREGSAVRGVSLPMGGEQGHVEVTGRDGRTLRWRAGLVVGADGPRSLVARAAGVDRPIGWFRRGAITVHHADPDAPPDGLPATAELVVGTGWYCGIAPVPRGRVNVGVVVGPDRLRARVGSGQDPGRVVDDVIGRLPGPVRAWQRAGRTDEVRVAFPLAHRPRRLGGPGWLLVGDAAGFIDPLSGEGILRALRSARDAADAILGDLGLDATAVAYDRRMRARTDGKDIVSWLLQAFLARPALAGYALGRLGRREDLRETFSRVLADLEPASRAVDPRYLLRVLAP